MRYGLNLLLWTDALTEEARPLLDEIKQLGFDAVEVPVFEIDVKKYAQWGKYLDDAGLARTAVTIRGADDNPMSSDPKIRRKGVDANKAAIDCCQAAGAEALVGPFHSGLGCFSGAGPTQSEWNWAVDSMRQAAEHAAQCGVTLALEYLNRFECYLLNTAADGARFCRDVNHPRCKMMYDTFHSHIEEKNTPAAIRALKGCLAHVHISENDRSTPGSGNVRWAETFDALK
jgi:D-psicose/D-tagatose/L-ribulose 3-epimerase